MITKMNLDSTSCTVHNNCDDADDDDDDDVVIMVAMMKIILNSVLTSIKRQLQICNFSCFLGSSPFRSKNSKTTIRTMINAIDAEKL